jgi:uncharacterized protein (TIGR03437 family)
MVRNVARKLTYTSACVFPVILFAFSTGPPIMRTGAVVDGGITCVACHATYKTANADPRGHVSIAAAPFVPGVTQTLSVTIIHPTQMRWGFQIAARLAGDPTKQAGTFSTNSLVRVRCGTGHDAPCLGALEFAEHMNAQFTAVGAGYTYKVDWTPPAATPGDVIFYAAGNAANGDGTFNGDYIYTTSAIVSPAIPCSMPQIPSVTAAVSAATWLPSISPGSLVAIFGSGFQPAGLTRTLYGADIAAGKLPQQLSCVAVEIDGIRAPLDYVSAGQINAQAPSGILTAGSQVRVILNPGTIIPAGSVLLPVGSAAYAPGIFTSDGKHAVAQFAGTAIPVGDPTAVPGAKAAKPGDMITLYATGLGDTQLHLDAGLIATSAASVVTPPAASIGGTVVSPSAIQYAGLVPGMVGGLYQINLTIPLTVPSGDLAVRLQSGGISSPDGVTIRVATQ